MSERFYHEVTDKQWKIIETQLPKAKATGRPSLNTRKVFNAMYWVLSSGAKWRYIPKEYGNWNSIYHKFRQWIDEGVFAKILQALIDDDTKYTLIEIDSTFCKVHQHAAGALKKYGEQAIAVSRGGKNTKIHALVNEHFQLIKVILTGGDVHDSECAISFCLRLKLKVKPFWLTKLLLLSIFVLSSFLITPLLVFLTNLMYTILTKNCINNAISLNVFFSV